MVELWEEMSGDGEATVGREEPHGSMYLELGLPNE